MCAFIYTHMEWCRLLLFPLYLECDSLTLERARILAAAVDGEVMSMEELNAFQPATGMVLANTTPIGMHPNAADTPILKVTTLN